MTTYQPGAYRTGGHHVGRTIIHVGSLTPDADGRRPDDQLIAHVDSAAPAGWAYRVCALLNAADRDARRKPTDCPRCGSDAPRRAYDVCGPCGVALAQEVDGDGPATGLRSTESAQEPLVGGSGCPGGSEAISGRCDCGREGLPPRQHFRPCPIAERHYARCICNDPPPTVDKPKNGTASRPPGWACPRHGAVI